MLRRPHGQHRSRLRHTLWDKRTCLGDGNNGQRILNELLFHTLRYLASNGVSPVLLRMQRSGFPDKCSQILKTVSTSSLRLIPWAISETVKALGVRSSR